MSAGAAAIKGRRAFPLLAAGNAGALFVASIHDKING